MDRVVWDAVYPESGTATAYDEQAWWDLGSSTGAGGGWTIYDPNSRLTTTPTKVTGYPGEYEFSLTSGWGSAGEGDLSGAAAGVTIYRTPRNQDGTDWAGGEFCRLTLWLERVSRTANQSLVLGVGQIGGNPATGATKIGRGHGILDAATTYVAQLTGTSNAGVWAFVATDQGTARCVETTITPIGRAKSFSIVSGGILQGSRQYVSNSILQTQTTGEFGAAGTPKEAVFIAANAAGSGTRTIRLKLRCGSIPEGCTPPSIWPNGNGAEKTVCILGDSQWYGYSYSTPWTMKAVERFLSRDWGFDFPAFRFEGVANNLSAATASYLSANTLKFAPSSGNLLSSINTNMAANCTTLTAAGESPDIFVITAGANDAAAGVSAATILGYYTSIANTIKATFPSAKVYIAAGGPLVSTTSPEAIAWGTVTASVLAAPPSGCDGPSLDWNSWKYGTNYPAETKAFFHASNDFHPKVPAGETAIGAWDTFSMDPAGADYTQNGAAANAYAFTQWLVAIGNGATTHAEVLAVQPPILSGEVRPY